MNLDPDQFPLRAIGVNIYGQMLSSPLLVAAHPDIAIVACRLLNQVDMTASAGSHFDQPQTWPASVFKNNTFIA